jgi:hypothetical protein
LLVDGYNLELLAHAGLIIKFAVSNQRIKQLVEGVDLTSLVTGVPLQSVVRLYYVYTADEYLKDWLN